MAYQKAEHHKIGKIVTSKTKYRKKIYLLYLLTVKLNNIERLIERIN